MQKNRSPWIHELNHEREIVALHSDITTDVAVVGAGIAGISTAFFLLKYTDKKVTLLEGGRLAHGATGHNAGQIVSYFERPFSELVEEFGLSMAVEGQHDIENSWELIDELYTDSSMDIPMSRFNGYGGFIDFESVIIRLKNQSLRKKGGLKVAELLVADSCDFLSSIPEEYKEFYTLVPHQKILDLLETEDSRFVAVIAGQKGVVNSALFCQEVVEYLHKTYSHRFAIYEHTHIAKVILKHGHAILDAETCTVIAERVVLCTNGFEDLKIFNETGLDIDTRFHHSVEGLVGFMSGYFEPYEKPPSAIAYHLKGFSSMDGDYIYVTRRQFESEEGEKKNLISVGGPEVMLEDRAVYSSDKDYPEEAQEGVNRFVKSILGKGLDESTTFQFSWHGLMGYTQNRVRLIGKEPKNDVLLYNLGCNGVGILPSIYGGKRISKIIAGEKLATINI